MIKATLTALALAITAAPVLAQDAPSSAAAAPIAPKVGDKIYSSEGSLLGRVESLRKEAGAVTSVRIIHNAHFATFALSTLSQGEKGITVGKTRKEVASMR